jgi:putative ABC transport system permease protein
MLRNFLLLATRNLLKRKVYSFINIFGLALGMAVCLVILNYVDFELSYDSYHQHAPQIYRVNRTWIQNGEDKGAGIISGYALGPTMVSEIPGIKTYIRTHPMYGGAVLTYERENNPVIFMKTTSSLQTLRSSMFLAYEAVEGDLKQHFRNQIRLLSLKKLSPGTLKILKIHLVSYLK